MLADHPEYAELFDYVARKGRSFRIHILFASQTLDVGKIKDIDKNTSYRIGLKVASPSVSRQIIGVEDAYHIESGKEHKGVGFLVPAPGATPIKFRSTYVDGIYDPPQTAKTLVVQSIPEPKLFTAAAVESEQATVISDDADDDSAGPPRKLIATIGEQLARYGPQAPQLWLPPLDEPIPLTAVLARAAIPQRHWRWPLGEIDKPFEMRRDPLVFDAIVVGRQHGDPRRPQVGQIDCAADVYPVGGQPALAARRDVLLPGLRRRAAARAAGSGARRQCRVAAGTRTHPPHLRRAGAAAAVPPAARDLPGPAADSEGKVTARLPTTASARCSWSSTTCTPSAATTPTSSTPVTRCWPR